MREAQNLLEMISKTVLALVFIDLGIVMIMMIAIAQGEPVQHIPFWDAQLKFIVNLMM